MKSPQPPDSLRVIDHPGLPGTVPISALKVPDPGHLNHCRKISLEEVGESAIEDMPVTPLLTLTPNFSPVEFKKEEVNQENSSQARK